ncbi:MAG: LCP family protein, partial [Actinomycetota bacterium]
MVHDDSVVLRRSWPQRLTILACLGVIGASIAASFFVGELYQGVADLGRIQFSGDLLDTETDPSEPVNFLIIGVDSAARLDPDDPAGFGRIVDERGTALADTIAIVRIDPVGGQAWSLTIPRDLLVEIPGARVAVQKVNAASLIGGAPLLVETVSTTFDIQINHYVELDFLAFREVVDDLDGVPMWFPRAAVDQKTGFIVSERGCHVLNGDQALAFVRSREEFREMIDGDFRLVDNTDLGRIERQQAFITASIDRAIARGARNPTTLSGLIGAAAESVVLDQGLTTSELVQLAEAFTDFDSATLQNFSPAVVDVIDPETGRWQGFDLTEPLDADMFQIFRGLADAISLSDVRFTVAGVDEATLVSDTELLRSLGFSVSDTNVASSTPATVNRTSDSEIASA